MPSSVFALPAALEAKNDPALIGRDEQQFAAIEEAIQWHLADTERRLDDVLRNRGGNPQERLHRDQNARRLTTRLGMLQRFGVDLCLGRMDFADGRDPIWVGRLGLGDAAGDRLLVDWRTPAAEPFFAATLVDPMGLSRRRRYRWSLGKITDYWDESFVAGARGASLDDQSAFIASLGESRSSQMRDVLSTIQADQDAIIRAESAGALVVEGGPGTGKTVVALHRAAYLLYADRRLESGRGGVLVIGPSDAYLRFVEDVLPGLGEEGVRITTLADLVPESALAVPEQDTDARRVKSTLGMVDAVEAAVSRFERVPTRRAIIETDWADIHIFPEDWANAMAAVEFGTLHNEARTDVRDTLLGIVSERYGEGGTTARAIRRALDHEPEIDVLLDEVWPILEPGDLVSALLTDPVLLRSVAPDLSDADIAAVQRADGTAWTDTDLPLLDAARMRVGATDAFEAQQRRRSAEATERAYRADIIDYLVDADDDGEGAIQMLRGDDSVALREKLIDWDALPDLAHDDARSFAHVIVDEAQELTDAQWAMLLRRDPARSFTIVGDRAQARDGFAQTWADRLARVGIRDLREMGLNVNYRTPSEVMDVAAREILAELPDAAVPQSIRSTGVPVRYGAVAERDAVLEGWLAAHTDGVAVVIGDPTYAGTDRVRSLTPATAKGLEFDLVVIVDPDAFGTGIRGAVDRYVAMTRATGSLVVLS